MSAAGASASVAPVNGELGVGRITEQRSGQFAWVYRCGGPGVVSRECPVTAAWCEEDDRAEYTLYLDAREALSFSCDGSLEHEGVATIFNATRPGKARGAQTCRQATRKVTDRGWRQSDSKGQGWAKVAHIVTQDKLIGLLESEEVNTTLPLQVCHVARLVGASASLRPPVASTEHDRDSQTTPMEAAVAPASASTVAGRSEARFPPGQGGAPIPSVASAAGPASAAATVVMGTEPEFAPAQLHVGTQGDPVSEARTRRALELLDEEEKVLAKFSSVYDKKQELIKPKGGVDVFSALRRAILTEKLRADTIEGDRLACLALNLDAQNLDSTRYTKRLRAWHQYLLLLHSARGVHDARRARRLINGFDLATGQPIEGDASRYNEFIMRSDDLMKSVRVQINDRASSMGAMKANPSCGFKSAAVKEWLQAHKPPDDWDRAAEASGVDQPLLGLRLGIDGTHCKPNTTVRMSQSGLQLRGDVCTPQTDDDLVKLTERINLIRSKLATSMARGRVTPPLLSEEVQGCLRDALVFVEAGISKEKARHAGLQAALRALQEKVDCDEDTTDLENPLSAEVLDEEIDVDGLGIRDEAPPDDGAPADDEADPMDTAPSDRVDDGAALQAIAAAQQQRKTSLASSLKKSAEHVRASHGRLECMQTFVDAVGAAVEPNAPAHAENAALRACESALTDALNAQRVGANQMVDIRLRDLANGISVVASRYLVKDPTNDELSTLLADTASKVADEMRDLGISGSDTKQILASSDGEASGQALWGATSGQHAQSTTTVRVRARAYTAMVAQEADKVVHGKRKEGKAPKGALKIKKDHIRPYVESEIIQRQVQTLNPKP